MFTAPVDRYRIVLTVTTLGVRYVEVARLFIYETISYDVTAVFYPNTLTVREDAERRLRVCVSLVSNNSFESPLIEVSRVSIVILNDTASSLDYEGMDESIETLTYFKAKDQFVTNSSSQSTYMECFRLNVANNDLVEGNKTVVLGLASPTGVIILSPERADSQATITIVDDDHYVTVTQEHSRYNVSENRLSVVVCGVLNTSDIIECAVNYEFEVSLNLRDMSAGMVIGFSSKEYTTTESLGEVSVCVKILNSFNGEALEPFTIALLPDEGFETANAVKDCYKTIEFVIGASVECHNYSIKDDNMCELGIPQQGFQIRLAIIATGKIPIRIDLKRSLATIVIDDTSEMECFVRVGFEEPSVVNLSENHESVEVCVNSTSPGIEEQFFINITSHNGKKCTFEISNVLMAPIPARLYFEVNQTNLTDIQCFDLSVDFSSALCHYFPNCTKSKLSLSLGEHNENNRVFIDVDKSTMDVDVQMPERCGCSAQISSSNSSLNGATVAAIVLVTLLVLLAIIVIVMLYRRWRQYNRQKAVAVAHDAGISNVYATLGESGLVYKAYIKSAVGNKLVAVKQERIDEKGIVKVADFGLTEDMYCRKYFRRDKSEPGGEEKVPIRWMAPESIKNDIYNEATDVVRKIKSFLECANKCNFIAVVILV
ncbi:Putative insulin-like peptide receptor [Geodia barretti]|uniref:Insulin-like peptide receptor n=1 Tax=Geodia barretti TaxID=519541 RepID=A0AA35XJK4_GEOBA|nr:Putative insulin-like peptide receptor [Geodia barretti]